MVAAFVKAEIDSGRIEKPYKDWLKYLGVDRDGLIDRPDLSNDLPTSWRYLLRSVRGHGIGALYSSDGLMEWSGGAFGSRLTN